MKTDLKHLNRRRDRLADQLQILEMQRGYHYMLKSPLYRKYKAIKAMCDAATKP